MFVSRYEDIGPVLNSVNLLTLSIYIYKSELDWLVGWLGLCAWLLGNDIYITSSVFFGVCSGAVA
jgi:hypothetical protein